MSIRQSTFSTTSSNVSNTLKKSNQIQRLSFARHRSLLSDNGNNPIENLLGAIKDKVEFKKLDQAYSGSSEEENFSSSWTPSAGNSIDSSPPTSLQQIFEGRTKSPYALQDLKEFIEHELEEEKSDGDLEKGHRVSGSLEAVMGWKEVVEFLERYYKYRNKFFSLPSSLRSLSPEPFTIIQNIVTQRPFTRVLPSYTPYSANHDPPTIDAVVERVMEEKLTHSFLNLPPPPPSTWSSIPPSASLPTYPRPHSSQPPTSPPPLTAYTSTSFTSFTTTTDFLPEGLDPKNQPMRDELRELIDGWVNGFGRKRGERGESELVRLARQALGEAKYTTHPSLLHPLSTHLISLLSPSLLPAFLSSDLSLYNIHPSTRKSRLYISIILFIINLIISILLLLNPSPFTLGKSSVPKVWRLLVTPTWGWCVKWLIDSQTGIDPVMVFRRKREKGEGRYRMLGLTGEKEKVGDGVRKRQMKRVWWLVGVWMVVTVAIEGQLVWLGGVN